MVVDMKPRLVAMVFRGPAGKTRRHTQRTGWTCLSFVTITLLGPDGRQEHAFSVADHARSKR